MCLLPPLLLHSLYHAHRWWSLFVYLSLPSFPPSLSLLQIPAFGYDEDQNLRYLVMSRLGPDVEVAQEGKAWSLPRKVGYARQMLALLRTLHESSKMVFVDVKPGTYDVTTQVFGEGGASAAAGERRGVAVVGACCLCKIFV